MKLKPFVSSVAGKTGHPLALLPDPLDHLVNLLFG